jgi:hypothetical protein
MVTWVKVSASARATAVAIAGLLALAAGVPYPAQAGSSVDTAMYFQSHVKDAQICSMSTNADGDIVFPDDIPNPAATCPDAFAWKQFLGAVQKQFWRDWANDETVWVNKPKAPCSDRSDTDCCFVRTGGDAKRTVGYRDPDGNVHKPRDVGGPGRYCPYIPGDWGGAHETTFAGARPISSHNTTFLRHLDPGRLARQQEAEVVYRNDAFVHYTAANHLYARAGLDKAFDRVAGQATNSKPHRPSGQGINYPPDAVMFKTDWIPKKVMLDLGYVSDHDGDPSTPPQNPEHPYITMKMKTKPSRNPEKGEYQERLYYLAAITGASKALPNWHWYAFEHVANPGRCDLIGCNDSYGFTNEVRVKAPNQPEGAETKTITIDSNYIAPHTQTDQLKDGTRIFDPGKTYESGTMTDGLAKLFKSTGIGAEGKVTDVNVPHRGDPAWRSYRLKGTQTKFYTNDGYPTVLGASITEGGFVNTASCLSCHVQASVDSTGAAPGVPGVGATGRLNLEGLGKVSRGAPKIGDYFDRGTTNQRAVQTDFVWGVLFAE